MNHYGLLQTISSANKNTKYKVELSYGEAILIKRNRGPIDTMGQQKNLKSLRNLRHNLRNLRKIRNLWKCIKYVFVAKTWSENGANDSARYLHEPAQYCMIRPRKLHGSARELHGSARGLHGSCTGVFGSQKRISSPSQPFSVRKHKIRPKITKTLPTPQFVKPIRQKKRQTRKNTNVNENMKSLQKVRQNPKITQNYQNCQTS